MSNERRSARWAVLLALAWSAGAAQARPPEGSGPLEPPSSSRSIEAPGASGPREAQAPQVDLFNSEHATWNTRSLNETLYFPGQSVNSVMFEKGSWLGRTRDLLPAPKVAEVEVLGSPPPSPVLRVQGRVVDLQP